MITRPDPQAPRTAQASPLLVLVLTLLMVVQPIATDLYLPALPLLKAHFHASFATAQLSLSVLMICFGLSQLAWGPLSDRLGRRPILLAGLSLYTAGAVVSALAPTLVVLLAARAVQGVGLAAATVCFRAMVRDLFEPRQGAFVLSKAMSALAPIAVCVPIAGGILAATVGWRGALLATALVGGGTLALIALRVGETAPQPTGPLKSVGQELRIYGKVGRNRTFLSWTALISAGYATMLGFFSGAPFVYVDQFGYSRPVFGMFLGSASIAFWLGTVYCRRWIVLMGLRGAARRAGLFTLASCLMFLLPALAGVHNAWTLTAALWLHLFAYGIHQPCGQAGLPGPFPEHAGAASALAGCLLACAAFASTAWIGVSFDGTARSLAFIGAGLTGLCAVLALTLVQRFGEPHLVPLQGG
ncbi:MAG: multidrug effflux MFS transporter [Burkholderiaceae bacterium]|nr:multidrug effflux MFS transporter [Burkholderiaceae bacterium]